VKLGIQKLTAMFRAMRRMDLSMRHRITAFFIVFVLTLLVGVMTILTLTGTFSLRAGEIRGILASGQRYLNQNAEKIFGDAAARSVELSREMSGVVRLFLQEKNLAFARLEGNGAAIRELEERLLTTLLNGLNATGVSGAFVTLNTTVNPALPNAANSRAGLYIRSGEPTLSGFYHFKLFLRGFQDLAIQNRISLQSKWDLEFDVGGKEFYGRVLSVHAADPALPLTRLYFWSPGGALGESDRNLMLCSAPILDADDNALGVCGFEIDEAFFREQFSGADGSLPGTVSVFSPTDDDQLIFHSALFAGDHKAYRRFAKGDVLQKTGETYGLSVFRNSGNGEAWVGYSDGVNLYAKGSPFVTRAFAVTTLLPKSDFDAAVRRQQWILAGIFSLFLAAGIWLAVMMSKRLVKPLTEQMDLIGTDIPADEFRTNIPEVDLLINRLLAAHSRGQELQGEAELRDGLFQDFLTAVRTLTPTELTIFKHYAEGLTNEEIQKKMWIAAGTIKTHKAHIYQKLNVRSRSELDLYVELIRKSGKFGEIFPDKDDKKKNS